MTNEQLIINHQIRHFRGTLLIIHNFIEYYVNKTSGYIALQNTFFFHFHDTRPHEYRIQSSADQQCAHYAIAQRRNDDVRRGANFDSFAYTRLRKIEFANRHCKYWTNDKINPKIYYNQQTNVNRNVKNCYLAYLLTLNCFYVTARRMNFTQCFGRRCAVILRRSRVR